MNKRADWVHCIGHTHAALIGNAWCGREERPFFTDVAHAAENGRKGGRLVACKECVAAVTASLANGHDAAGYDTPPDREDAE